MRLIDIDALPDDCAWCCDALIEAINDAPTVDAVEVVRCKDCKYRDIFRHESEMGDSSDEYCRWHPNESPDDDDYCSFGERGDSDDERTGEKHH